MTQTQKLIAKIAAFILLGSCALAVGGWVGQLITPPLDVTPPAATQVYEPAHRIDAIPAPQASETLSPAQQSAAEGAADRVCEGLTAGVPVTTLEIGIAREGGMSLPEAHDWVAQVAVQHCR